MIEALMIGQTLITINHRSIVRQFARIAGTGASLGSGLHLRRLPELAMLQLFPETIEFAPQSFQHSTAGEINRIFGDPQFR